MKCLSVRQPWAWAIIHGSKRVENRTRRTVHRGPLLVHAAKSTAFLDGTTPEQWQARGLASLPDFDRLAYGTVIGVVELVDCQEPDELHGYDFVEGPICWLLKNPRPLESPIPWRALPGLFEVPDELIK